VHAFVILIERYRPSMLRLAAGYVPNQAIAEEVVQDAWLGPGPTSLTIG
jgi:RNA polymerase sigma-70 factor, ECF subfamily